MNSTSPGPSTPLLGIDPYIKPGDPSSGLLPGVNPDAGGEDGEGDKRLQAYCFRMCLTDVPANRVTIEKPEGYQKIAMQVAAEIEKLLR